MSDAIDYRFNNGRGAVLCRKCRVILDTDLSYDEAVRRWAGKDMCIKHKRKVTTERSET